MIPPLPDDVEAEAAKLEAARAAERAQAERTMQIRAMAFEIRLARIIGNAAADKDGACKHCGLQMDQDGEGNWLHLPAVCPGPITNCTCGAQIRHKAGERTTYNLDGSAHTCSRMRLVTTSSIDAKLPHSLRAPRVPRRTYGDE